LNRGLGYSKNISPFGFEGLTLYEVMIFFIKGIRRGSIKTRASAVAFDFFLALFPFFIFIFTLIPFVPMDDFQTHLLDFLNFFLPLTVFEFLESHIVELVTKPQVGVLSLGFFMGLYFSQSGIDGLIQAFHSGHHKVYKRHYLTQNLQMLGLIFLLPAFVGVGLFLIVYGSHFIKDLTVLFNFERLGVYFLIVFRWGVIIALFLLSISSLYYVANSAYKKFRLFSVGAILATFLILITSVCFSYFVDNFKDYNKIYGSIGGIIVFLLWIYYNSVGLILGFELNASVLSAKNQKTSSL
jgi:membrane protein